MTVSSMAIVARVQLDYGLIDLGQRQPTVAIRVHPAENLAVGETAILLTSPLHPH